MDAVEMVNQRLMPFAKLLGLKVVEASPDKVVAELEVRDELCTTPAVMHGGALMALADTLGGVATFLNLPEDKELRDRLARHEAMLILSTRSGCAACHLMDAPADSRLMPLAPAYREIARRYRDDSDAESKLLRSIVQGTRSATKIWPNVNMQFMPPNVGLAREDAKKLATWILELK